MTEEKREKSKCRYCDVPVYFKTVQYTAPIMTPLTEVQALRNKLLEKTGEVYLEIPKRFCPVCGREIGGNENA